MSAVADTQYGSASLPVVGFGVRGPLFQDTLTCALRDVMRICDVIKWRIVPFSVDNLSPFQSVYILCFNVSFVSAVTRLPLVIRRYYSLLFVIALAAIT